MNASVTHSYINAIESEILTKNQLYLSKESILSIEIGDNRLTNILRVCKKQLFREVREGKCKFEEK